MASGMSATAADVRRHIGQLAIVGFDGLAVPPELKTLVREFDLAGVILFARNVESPGQVRDLSREVSSLARDLPLWVSVDQEGGRVARLRAPFTEWPPMRTLGAAGDENLASRFAKALALELQAVGISLDYAPVLDVHTNPANRVIGDRALGDQAADVARLGRVIVRELQAAGIAACGKHFPGHGDTALDSHADLPIVEHPPERLREVEFVPFRAAIDEQVASIMTAHVLIPAVDAEHPVAMSPAIVQGWLRKELKYEGLILSDDLGMRAISDRYHTTMAAIGAVAAGCDAVLLCGPEVDKHAAVLEALIHATEQEQLPRQRLDDAVSAQRRVKERFLLPTSTSPGRVDWRRVIGCEEHQAIAAEMAGYGC
jgi:beta-N-acetylhexosaminidase